MRICLVSLLLLFSVFSRSQSVTIGPGTYAGNNIYGPMYATAFYDTAYSLHAYIYPYSLLTGLLNGDTISSMEFYADADQAMTGNVNLEIYLKMAKNDTFPAGDLNWTKEKNSTGVVLVYSGNPVAMMNGTSEFKNFIFNVNKFKFDTLSGAKNLEVLFRYQQFSRQPTNTYWYYENNFSVTTYKSRNEGKINYGSGRAPDTTRFSDVRKPYVRINFPRYKNNLEIIKTYCLGKVPLLAGVTDSTKVLIANRGKQTVSGSKIYLTNTGANVFSDSLTLPQINPWEEKLITFGKFKPDSSGNDIQIISLSKDDLPDNNYDTILRQINYNVFSHCDPNIGNAGGIGFSGSTGDFVAKFFCDTGVYINQVSVDFSSSGRGFRVGIWDDNGTGGMPGTVLFMSDSLTSKGGTYILPVLPRVKISGGFYVGIRQNTTTNVAFSFQDEDPIRPGAFYFTAPMGNTVWTPFSPGFPYKFNIQPRIQVGDDVAPVAITYPAANQDIEYNLRDSIAVKATIVNYGFNDQTKPFEVECKISDTYNTTEYLSKRNITLNAGQSKTIVFDSAFKLYNLGDHKITITTKLANDKVVDNNVLNQNFKVSVKHDIGADLMYSPTEASIYEYNLDTLIPTVRINNFGTFDKNNFKVVFRIKNDTAIIHSESFTKSLAAGKQEIMSFSKYVPKFIGDYVAECFTIYKDSIPFNDTVRANITFQKSNDVGPKSIDIPLTTTPYPMGGFFFARTTIKNYGLKSQIIPFKTHLYIYSPKGVQVHYDTVSTQLGGFSETQLLYKRFNIPNEFGKYKIMFITGLDTDQERRNDTLVSSFTVIPNRDLTTLKLIHPQKDTVISVVELPFFPKVLVKNLGSQTQNPVGPVMVKIFKNNSLVYFDSVTTTGNISYNSTFPLTLKSQFNSTLLGDYKCEVYTKLSGDLIPSNDTLYSNFRVTRNYDLGLDTISNFTNGQVFQYTKGWFKPQILVKNYGSIGYNQAFSVDLNLYKNGSLLISKTINFDSLTRNATTSWFQDSLINLRQTGNFILTAKVNAAIDQNNLNDSAAWSFSIVKPNDLQIDSITFPDKYNYCYEDKTYRPRVKVSNVGTTPIVSTQLDLKIFQTTNYIWFQSLSVDLPIGGSKWMVFDSTLTFGFTGSAWARAVGYLLNDNEKSNDTLIRSFNIDKTSGLAGTYKQKYAIVPNPSFGEVAILTPDNAPVILQVLSATGQIVYSNSVTPSQNEIHLDLKSEINLEAGIYFIKLKNATETQLFKLMLF